MKVIRPNQENLKKIWQEGSKNRFISFMPSLISAIVIVILSAIPGDQIHLPPIWNIDKYLHLGVYFVQTLVLLIGYRLYFGKELIVRKAIRTSLIISISLGGLLEILQEYVFISRSGDYLDFTANSLGAIAACIIGFIIIKNQNPPA